MLLFSILFSIDAVADQRIIDYYVEAFHEFHQENRDPGILLPELETVQFLVFLIRAGINDDAYDHDNPDLTFPEVIQVVEILNAKYGYRISNPPLSAAEFSELREMHKVVQRTYPFRIPPEIAAKTQSFSERMAEIRKQHPVPRTEVEVPPLVLSGPLQEKYGTHNPTLLVLNEGGKGQEILRDAFALIATTPHGRPVLDEFLARIERNEVVIEPLADAPETFRKLFGNQLPGALYVSANEYDDGRARVYVNLDRELGIFTEILFHEMIHAVDPSLLHYERVLVNLQNQHRKLIAGIRKRLENPMESWRLAMNSTEQRENRVLENEIRAVNKAVRERYIEFERTAHDGQGRFKTEVGARFPNAGRYYHVHISHGTSNPIRVSDQFLQMTAPSSRLPFFGHFFTCERALGGLHEAQSHESVRPAIAAQEGPKAAR